MKEKREPRVLNVGEIERVKEAATNVLTASEITSAVARTWAHDALDLAKTVEVLRAALVASNPQMIFAADIEHDTRRVVREVNVAERLNLKTKVTGIARQPTRLAVEEIDAVVHAVTERINTHNATEHDCTILDLVETMRGENHDATMNRQTLTAMRGLLKVGEGQEFAALGKLNGEHDEYARQLGHIRAALDRVGLRLDDYYEAPNGVQLLLNELTGIAEALGGYKPVVGELVDIVSETVEARDNAHTDLIAIKAGCGDVVPTEVASSAVLAARYMSRELRRIKKALARVPVSQHISNVTPALHTEILVGDFEGVDEMFKRIKTAVEPVLMMNERMTVADAVEFVASDRLELINERGRLSALLGDSRDVFAEVSELLASRHAVRDELDEINRAVSAVFEGTSVGKTYTVTERVKMVVASYIEQRERLRQHRPPVRVYAEQLANVLGLDTLDDRLLDNVLAHVVSLVADRNQLGRLTNGISIRLGLCFDGDDDLYLKEVEAVATKLALWRDERRRIAEYIAAEYGLSTSEPLDVFALVKGVLDQWQAYGQGECAKICTALDTEMIDGDGLIERVLKLVELLKEAEGSKERLHAELDKAQSSLGASRASLDVFVRDACEMCDVLASAGVERGMLNGMVERVVKMLKDAVHDKDFHHSTVIAVAAALGFDDPQEMTTDPDTIIATVRSLQMSFGEGVADFGRLSKILTEAGAPSHGLSLAERLRWLARQRDTYKTHALERGMFAEGQNRRAYDAVRAVGARLVNADMKASERLGELHDLMTALGLDPLGNETERLVAACQLANAMRVERVRLDDALGFGRNPKNDRVGAVCDIVAREVEFKNAIASALGAEPHDNLVNVAASVRETRNELTRDLERIKTALGESEVADVELVSEAVEMLVAHHTATRARLNEFERAAFDEYMTAREAFEYGVTTGVGGDLDEDDRLAAFDRWYKARPLAESTNVKVDRRKLALAAFIQALDATGSTERPNMAHFNLWYERVTARMSEGGSEAQS